MSIPRLLAFAPLIMILNVSAIAASEQTSSTEQMTFRQARASLVDLFNESYFCPANSNPLRRQDITYYGIGTIQFKDIESVVTENEKLDYRSLGCAENQVFHTVKIELRSRNPRQYLEWFWTTGAPADQFADSLRWLISNADREQAREQSKADRFSTLASAWRAAAVKPAMPNGAHVHEVLAKNAIEEKNFDKAIDEYEAGLEIFPTWPEDQFNLALICGETADYDCAVEHMQDYLELVPDAPDAQAAKDKLIVWQDKLKGGE